MAAFTSRGNSWRAEVNMRGHRVSASFPTKAAARAWASKIEGEILAGERGEIPDKTFGELLDRYLADVAHKKKGYRWESIRIAAVKACPIASVKLKDLDSRAVVAWRDARLKEVSDASVNRDWNTFSAACSIAVGEWKWLKVNPFSKAAGARRPPSTAHRQRLADPAELESLEHAAADFVGYGVVVQMAKFAVETAMRAGEIHGLTSASVDTNARVARLVDTWADRAKNGGEFTSIKTGKGRDVPLSAEAVRVWHESGGQGFNISAKVRDAAWRKLCAKAGIVDLHFHDLRHTAITRLAKKLHVMDLARMTGHGDINELLTYYNESAENIATKL